MDCTDPDCDHSTFYCYEWVPGFTSYCTFSFGEGTDSSYTFKLKNTLEDTYSNLIAKDGNNNSFLPTVNEIGVTRTSVDGLTADENGNVTYPSVSGFDYKFVLYRGDDDLSYAQYKNDLSLFGFNSLTEKSSKTRKEAEYFETLKIALGNNESDISSSSTGSQNCTDSDTGNLIASEDGSVITNESVVKVETYSGTYQAPNTDTGKTFRVNGTTTKIYGVSVSTNTSIKFNPFIQMTYQGLNDSDKTNVNVLSEFRREILPNDYGEISWNYKAENLSLESQMFALDAMLTNNSDDKDWTAPNQVLKGGASYQLVGSGDQAVTVRTFQTILPDESRSISEVTGSSSLTVADAEVAHNNFVDSTVAYLSEAELVQYVNSSSEANPAWGSGGIPVSSGSDISSLGNGSKISSTDTKYYLKSGEDVTIFQRSNLVASKGETTSVSYRFSSDVEGNIYMNTDIILNKTQGIESLSGTALNINNCTGVVTKLLAAIERNTGDDPSASWAPDGAWYNEAYSGITVLVQTTTVKVGLGEN